MRRGIAVTAVVILLTGIAAIASANEQARSATTTTAGKCLEGYVYVTVEDVTLGQTTTRCVLPTDCGSNASTGPATVSHDPVVAGHYVSVPLPTGVDATCYL